MARYEMQAAQTLLQRLGAGPSPLSVWTAQAERRAQEWVAALGLARSIEARARFRETAPGALSGRVYASAIDRGRLEVATTWIGWLFLIDDQMDEGATGKNPRLFRERLQPFFDMAAEMAGTAAVATAWQPAMQPAGLPLLCALREIWYRLASSMPQDWCAAFARHYFDYLCACEWEAANRANGRVPSVDEYPAKRRDAGAIWPSLDLLEYVADAPLDPSLRDHALLIDIRTACADVVCWTDDLLTVAKERAHGDVHNLVIVLEHATRCDERKASENVARKIELRIAEFEAMRKKMFAMNLNSHAHSALSRYVDGLHHWMRGHLEWGLQTIRYDANPASSAAYLEDLLSAGE